MLDVRGNNLAVYATTLTTLRFVVLCVYPVAGGNVHPRSLALPSLLSRVIFLIGRFKRGRGPPVTMQLTSDGLLLSSFGKSAASWSVRRNGHLTDLAVSARTHGSRVAPRGCSIDSFVLFQRPEPLFVADIERSISSSHSFSCPRTDSATLQNGGHLDTHECPAAFVFRLSTCEPHRTFSFALSLSVSLGATQSKCPRLYRESLVPSARFVCL